MLIDRAESSGSKLLTVDFGTTACTIADSRNPKFNAQKISQNMANAMLSAWMIAAVIPTMVGIEDPQVLYGFTELSAISEA